MTGLQWYPRYTGDYARDTKQLSMMEHGAFTLLLDHYYSTGLPLLSNANSNASSNAELMPDHSRLYRLCGAISKEEQAAVDHIIMTFFYWTDDGYVNNKASQTIEKQQAAHAKRVNAGRKGGQSNAPSNASSNAKAKPKQPEPEPEPIIYKDLFERFISKYPKKSDIDMAFKLFCSHVKDGADAEKIIGAAQKYASEVEGREPGFIKSPATFLSKKIYLEPAYNVAPLKPVDTSDWEDWKIDLSETIGVAAVQSWFKTATLKNGTLTVESRFIQDWIKNNFSKQIKAINIKNIEVMK